MTMVLARVSPMSARRSGAGTVAHRDDLRGARGVVFATMLCLGFWGMLLTAVLG